MKKINLKAYVKKMGENKYQAIASTDAVDRYGDIVDQSGWTLDNYMKNPVMLWAHNSSTDGVSQIPVAKCTGIDRSQAGKLIVSFEFNSAEGSPIAPYIQNSYDNGFLNALSVGFMANESQGNVITSAELLEISFVPVPANQEALRLAMTKGLVDLGKKDLGSIRIDIEKAIDALNKGEVSVQLDAEEAYEQKWEKWDEISEVLSALWTVYFDEKTPVEDFSSLLAEAIELLNEVAENDGVDEDDADEDEKALIKSHKERLTKFLGGRTIKSGKAISKKNAELIQKAIDHMKECSAHLTEQAKAHTENAQTHNDHVTALEEMLNTSSSSETGGGNKSVESVPAGSLVISEQDIKVMRQSFRSLDRTAELALSIVDRFLTTRDSKK